MIWIALLLGIVEGMTEFIPVSSTGHLILLVDLLGFQGPPGKVFEIVIQLGAILAICWLYRSKLSHTLSGMAKRDTKNWHFALSILIAFLPAMVLGALFHDYIKTALFNPINVACALMLGGVAILLIERYKPEPKVHEADSFSYCLSLKLGLCQCLALIPGTSRSGATIMGALLLGVDRKAATEFSFFLAIPTMLAATVYDLYKNWHSLSFDGIQLIVIGFVAAFISAMLVVRFVIAYVARHGFMPFAYYRIALGAVILLMLR